MSKKTKPDAPPDAARSLAAPAAASSAKRIVLGRIVAAHGIRGDVVVQTFTETPEGIAAYGPLTDEHGARTFHLTVIRATPKGVVARIAGIRDRNGAEALRGTTLHIDRDRLPPPEEGAFYYEDLVGMAARDPAGAGLGTVVGVSNFGAGDLIELRLEGQNRTEFIPFSEPYVHAVDLDARQMTIEMPATTDARPEEPLRPDKSAQGEDDKNEVG